MRQVMAWIVVLGTLAACVATAFSGAHDLIRISGGAFASLIILGLLTWAAEVIVTGRE